MKSGGRRRELVRWVVPTEDHTFGRNTIGTEVAPLWLSARSKHGYLRRAGIVQAVKSVLRRAGKMNGGVHTLRRRAFTEHRPDSVRNPALVEKVLQGSEQIQRYYAVSDDKDSMEEMVARLDPETRQLTLPTQGGTSTMTPVELEPDDTPDVTLRASARRRRIRPQINARDVFGR